MTPVAVPAATPNGSTNEIDELLVSEVMLQSGSTCTSDRRIDR